MSWNHYQKNQEEEAELVSKINSAGLINSTLENLWKDCYNAISSGDFLKWNRKLDSIWLILGGEPNVPEEEFNRIDLQLHKLGNLNMKTSGFEGLPSGWQDVRSKQYIKLREKSLFLRKLQNKQGKGTAYQSEDEDDWD